MNCFCTLLILALAGWNCLAVPLAHAQTVGAVIVHGKRGNAVQMLPLRNSLQNIGVATAAPDMCWSGERIYDQAYLDCLLDIDASVSDVKKRGASKIYIIGMSLGGNAALAYGGRRTGLAGIIALAPAPAVEFVRKQPRIAESIEHAEGLLRSGQGHLRAAFADVDVGLEFTVQARPSVYLSFFGPTSAASMPDNAERLSASLLIVSGRSDASQRSVPYVFGRAAANPVNKHILVDADHRGTFLASEPIILKWLSATLENR
jgi:dienelactone hydrolase